MNLLRKLVVLLVLVVMAGAIVRPMALAQPQVGLTPQAYLPVVMTGCDDYFDYFDNPNSGWPQLDDDLVTMEYLNGEYRILSKQAPNVFGSVAPTTGPENYVVEADARFNGPATDGLYGLMFGVVTQGTEVTQFYLFAVEPGEQQFRLFRRETTGAYTTLVNSTPSTAIHPATETNHLTAIRNGDQITLAVNGTTLGTWADNTITGPTYTGLVLSPHSDHPQADARFDNYHVHICVPGGSGEATAVSGERTAASFQHTTPFTVYDSFDLSE